MALLCAGVISPANAPVHIHNFQDVDEHDPNKFQHILHCSLDVVEERLKAGRGRGLTRRHLPTLLAHPPPRSLPPSASGALHGVPFSAQLAHLGN